MSGSQLFRQGNYKYAAFFYLDTVEASMKFPCCLYRDAFLRKAIICAYFHNRNYKLTYDLIQDLKKRYNSEKYKFTDTADLEQFIKDGDITEISSIRDMELLLLDMD